MEVFFAEPLFNIGLKWKPKGTQPFSRSPNLRQTHGQSESGTFGSDCAVALAEYALKRMNQNGTLTHLAKHAFFPPRASWERHILPWLFDNCVVAMVGEFLLCMIFMRRM